jgi:hypothetical protein
MKRRTITEAERARIVMEGGELGELIRSGRTIQLNAYEAWIVLIYLQEVLQHANKRSPAARTAREVGLRIQQELAPVGSALREAAERGWRGE